MTGDFYQVLATVRTDLQSRHSNSNYAGLDTCGGCNLIRADQVPFGAQIVEVSRGPQITAAQGQTLPIMGAVKLLLRLDGSQAEVEVACFVVQNLVVPLLLGTPWIDGHVLAINPKERIVKVQLDRLSTSFETTLSPTPVKDGAVVRVAVSRAIPAFAEAWVQVRTNRSGLAVIRPVRRRDQIVQAKNGIPDLPVSGTEVLCLVANLGDRPIMLQKGQVV